MAELQSKLQSAIADRIFLIWVAVIAATLVVTAIQPSAAWLIDYPKAWQIPLADVVNIGADWFIDSFKFIFRFLADVLEYPMRALQWVLHALPWAATLALFSAVAYFSSGWRLAAFTAAALFYMALTGYWNESMNTLALVGISVPGAIALGFALGVSGHASPRWRRTLMPILDLMQTVPAFAYLIPILLLFGFGPVVGMIASLIFATPAMVRNVLLGLDTIPETIVEAGRMCGASARQLFWRVKVPSAMHQFLIGVNQTTMAGLSMVIIAAIIGGFDDIGWEVLSQMRKARFGESLMSGLVIAFLAMVMDRISYGFADRSTGVSASHVPWWMQRRYWIGLIAVPAVFIALSFAFEWLASYPKDWIWDPAAWLNQLIKDFTRDYRGLTTSIKNNTLFFFMLPLKIGLQQTISPFSWGFEFTPVLKALYWALLAAVSAYAFVRRNWPIAVCFAIVGIVLFFGLTGLPWPTFIVAVGLIAWIAGGRNLAIFAVLSLLFVLTMGLWKPAMLSLYLVSVAILLCLVIGGTLGILAANNQWASWIIRPINDTLQTMPQFVFLIPILMVFQVGDFTALLAIIAYAIVPITRYTEHGIRQVSHDVVEAGRMMGCTKLQLLFQVQLPMAVPQILLGLNQTVLYGIGMLVIAALVGTTGLGQRIYIALSDADAGRGIVAGLAMALVAMIIDRILQGFSEQRKAALGLS